MSRVRKILASLLVVTLTTGVVACGDPYKCDPGERDGDGDGRCNE